MNFPRVHLPAVVSRLKVMAHLNIAERRRPQDGRFSFQHENGSKYDLRLSLMPLIYGEKAVMRVLEKSSTLATAERLGFFPEQRELFESCIQRPNGIILVTGPTGSGKIHNTLCRTEQHQRFDAKYQHRRRSGRVQPAGRQSGSGASCDRNDLRLWSSRSGSPGSGRDHGRRDP